MKKGVKRALCLAFGLVMAVSLVACNQSSSPNSVGYGDSEYISFVGRNGETEEGIRLYNGAAGFTVNFKGTNLSAVCTAGGSWNSYLSVFVDGKKDSNENIVRVSTGAGQVQVTLVENLEEGEHTVRVLRRNDSFRSFVTVSRVETDGVFRKISPAQGLKIEFYGDSITNGSGVLRSITKDETTGKYNDSGLYDEVTQNALQSYAFVASEQLGATAQYYGRGGITLGFDSGKTVLNNPSALAVDLDAETYPYDYAFEPDAVVIYLGTNDYFIGQSHDTGYTPDGLRAAFVRFLREVIGMRYGKEIPVVLCSGLMPPDNLYEITENVKKQLGKEFPNLHTLNFASAKIGHPDVEDNLAAGELLANKIKEIFEDIQ